MAKEFRTNVINIKFTVISAVSSFKTPPYEVKFHDSRDRFMMVRDNNLKDTFIKLDLKFDSKRAMQIAFLEFLKQVGSMFKGESAKVPKNRLRIR